MKDFRKWWEYEKAFYKWFWKEKKSVFITVGVMFVIFILVTIYFISLPRTLIYMLKK